MLNSEFNVKSGPFEPTMESLSAFKCPDWFRDAKFGIWSHWGPQSAPMFGDWYARHMFTEGSDCYRYHCRKYGHPSKFGYDKIIPLWKAEDFDPAGLMDLYVRAGAKYFVGQAMHHDNFDNFDSKHNQWNSVTMGPMKDICQLWKTEAEKHGLPFGLSEHLGASYTWFAESHKCDKTGKYKGVPYAGADPALQSLYRDNNSEFTYQESGLQFWYTTNEKYHQDWFRRIKDVIDKFQPDLLYSDGRLPFEEYGRRIVAHLYNTSASIHGGENQAVYCQKHEDVASIGILDVERGIRAEIEPKPWQNDTSVGDWFYNVKDVYKTPEEIIATLIDCVSNNGNLLLNVPQLPGGGIDEECGYILEQIEKWMAVNNEGVFYTRPYRVAGEGKTKLKAGTFMEGSAEWKPHDFRFSQKDNVIYAFRMANNGEGAAISNFGRLYEKEIVRVDVLGYGERKFEQRDGALLVDMPTQVTMKSFPACIKVIIKD